MVPQFHAGLVALGAVGGLLPDVLRFAKERQKGFPEWFTNVGYWVGLAVLVALGGLAAWLGGAGDWKAAIAMGFGAPEIISKLVAYDSTQMRDREGFSLRRWWAV